MNPDALNRFEWRDGVYVAPGAPERFADFGAHYLALREKEGQIASLEQIRKLPEVDLIHPDYKHWQIRKKSIDRFLHYLSQKKGHLDILDVGCGNGFFTQRMQQQGHHLSGIDAHFYELRQATRAFPDSGIKWYFADILQDELPGEPFDLITFCASFHYFRNPKLLLERCLTMLREGGEIHIIDSPFYNKNDLEGAKERSKAYFQNKGEEAMVEYFHHNSFNVLDGFDIRMLYKPSGLLKGLLVRESPMPWFMIKHKNSIF
ncbi:MAG TPA: class I SAM-dependent methyltransferase [Bacteroidia bacterium]|nr:class I SAM-dependent methyltransferase [Bacteroidia bacterium]